MHVTKGTWRELLGASQPPSEAQSLANSSHDLLVKTTRIFLLDSVAIKRAWQKDPEAWHLIPASLLWEQLKTRQGTVSTGLIGEVQEVRPLSLAATQEAKP